MDGWIGFGTSGQVGSGRVGGCLFRVSSVGLVRKSFFFLSFFLNPKRSGRIRLGRVFGFGARRWDWAGLAGLAEFFCKKNKIPDTFERTHARETRNQISWVVGLFVQALHLFYIYITHYSLSFTSVLFFSAFFFGEPHYSTLHYASLHYTTLHYTTLHYTTLHYTTLHYTTLHSLGCLVKQAEYQVDGRSIGMDGYLFFFFFACCCFLYTSGLSFLYLFWFFFLVFLFCSLALWAAFWLFCADFCVGCEIFYSYLPDYDYDYPFRFAIVSLYDMMMMMIVSRAGLGWFGLVWLVCCVCVASTRREGSKKARTGTRTHGNNTWKTKVLARYLAYLTFGQVMVLTTW
ncbi:hypothetical protein B0T19DRAFT_235080 [Cercophora scortea]|uniref:Uncharacterized protein n=1 Tax=Cercophora scortea TaxID=314031 RepID=A0AAE0IHX5_9PEZI|nr:hypothetical protein B0T19DRAFT_235080 [Cercophora scortea]